MSSARHCTSTGLRERETGQGHATPVTIDGRVGVGADGGVGDGGADADKARKDYRQ